MDLQQRIAYHHAKGDFQLPGQQTFLRLGFEPMLADENQRQRWRDVFAAMDRPHLAEQFEAILTGPVSAVPASD
jgi:hypothetical protein